MMARRPKAHNVRQERAKFTGRGPPENRKKTYAACSWPNPIKKGTN
jgi:hypothetical protein